MRVATWNVNSVTARVPRLVAWLDEVGPDVLCLQETKCATEAFPVEPMTQRGYEVVAHVTEPERAALAELRGLGLTDVVPRALKYGTPYTYWDYRAGMFPKNQGMRIDLVYANAAAADRVTDAYVDREARKGKGPSDHAPVVVDLDL
jgi:exonuclease III